MTHTSRLTLDQKERTTLPEKIRPDLGDESIDFILLEREHTEMAPNDQLWFHHPEMQTRVARAERDFVEGRSTRTQTTQTPEEAQALLDSLKQLSNR